MLGNKVFGQLFRKNALALLMLFHDQQYMVIEIGKLGMLYAGYQLDELIEGITLPVRTGKVRNAVEREHKFRSEDTGDP